jgi:ABC-type transport system involved in cytochrome c biogenesis ATPase subunit
MAAVAFMETLLQKHLARGGMVALTTHQDATITTRASQRLMLPGEEASA